jgi:hypothetical protein
MKGKILTFTFRITLASMKRALVCVSLAMLIGLRMTEIWSLGDKQCAKI